MPRIPVYRSHLHYQNLRKIAKKQNSRLEVPRAHLVSLRTRVKSPHVLSSSDSGQKEPGARKGTDVGAMD